MARTVMVRIRPDLLEQVKELYPDDGPSGAVERAVLAYVSTDLTASKDDLAPCCREERARCLGAVTRMNNRVTDRLGTFQRAIASHLTDGWVDILGRDRADS